MEIKTQRLLLRPVTLDDLDLYIALLTSPAITQFLPGRRPFHQSYIRQYLPKKVAHWQEKQFGTFVLCLKHQPHIKIGYAGVEQIPETMYCDVRYAVLTNFQGKGYVQEAMHAVLAFMATRTWPEKIYGLTMQENGASKHILEKLGMLPSKTTIYADPNVLTYAMRNSSSNTK